MKIIVLAKTNAKKELVERATTLQSLFAGAPQRDTYKVSVHEPPLDGKANRAIIRVVAKYFNVAPSLVTIVSGLTAKTKTLEIRS